MAGIAVGSMGGKAVGESSGLISATPPTTPQPLTPCFSPPYYRLPFALAPAWFQPAGRSTFTLAPAQPRSSGSAAPAPGQALGRAAVAATSAITRQACVPGWRGDRARAKVGVEDGVEQTGARGSRGHVRGEAAAEALTQPWVGVRATATSCSPTASYLNTR